jgi:hypothetical protein
MFLSGQITPSGSCDSNLQPVLSLLQSELDLTNTINLR